MIGGVLAVGGSYSIVVKGVKQGPFPADGVIPFLKPLAYYGWAVGLASALLVYALLGRVSSRDQWVVRARSLIQIIEARRWRPAR